MTALAIHPDALISGALSMARRQANRMRFNRTDPDSWHAGYRFGLLIADVQCAMYRMIGADLERGHAALNEIRFLFTEYQDGNVE